MPLPTPCNIDQECLKFFACNTLETPRPGIVYSPYVEMAFGSLFNNNRIFLGVGNNSAPSSNLAAIKSLASIYLTTKFWVNVCQSYYIPIVID